MQISKESLNALRAIYAKEFGKIITEEEALEMATRILDLYQIIYRPLPGETRPPTGDPPHRTSSGAVE